MSEALAVERADTAEALVVVVRGEIDGGTTPILRDAVDAARAETARQLLVLDLSDVTFLDSAGLATLVELDGNCRAAGQRLEVVCTSYPVLRPLRVTRLDEVLTIVGNRPGSTSD